MIYDKVHSEGKAFKESKARKKPSHAAVMGRDQSGNAED